MQLNVYLISHPIIKQLANQIIYSTSKTNQINNLHYNYSQLNILLIYEIVRKWVKLNNIYIKNTNFTKKLCVFDSRESYLIIANLMHYGNLIPNIQILLPKVYLQHLELNKNTQKYINDDCLDRNIITIMKKQKIIIMENFLINYSIIKLLDYLLLNKKINIKQIKILCIMCNNNILEKIGHKYPSLEIYTTQINNC